MNGTCGRFSPSTPGTTTDDGHTAAADSARPDHPAADLSQQRIERQDILAGILSEYQFAARPRVKSGFRDH